MDPISETIDRVLSAYKTAERSDLIPILQDIQDTIGYVHKNAVHKIGLKLDIPPSKIFGVLTFYNQFRTEPPGKYHIMVCRGTACHVKGSEKILKTIQNTLKIEPGQTTSDGLFSLEVVACVGACGLSPVINISGEFYARVTPESVREILKTLKSEAKEEAQRDV
jgi:NADH-quinone oxidoreductase subunit E